MERLYDEFKSHHSDLLQEMWPTHDQLQQKANVPAGTHVLNARGPILNKAMNRFAAKLALALHFKMTGAIASTAAAIAGRWYSNHQAYTGAIPEILLKAVRNAAGTLVQGKWNVGEQFAYAGAHTASGKQSLFVARFREAFAVAGMVYDELEPPEVEGFSVVRPGFLRSNS